MRELVYIDTETHPFAPGNMAPPIVCLTWSLSDTSCHGILLRDEIEDWLAPVLDAAAAGEVVIAGHSISYDFGCVLEHFPRLRDKVWRAYGAAGVTCTKVREKLLDIAAGWLRGRFDETNDVWEVREYSLDDLAGRYLNKKLDKGEDGWRVRYNELDGVPLCDWPDRALNYAIGDSVDGAKVFRLQDDRAIEMRYLLPTQFEETKADLGLRLASAHGIYADGPRTMKLAEETIEKMDELRGVLFQNGLVKRKFKTKRPDLFTKDTKAIRNLIVETWPADAGKLPLTKTEKIKTGKEVLEMCEHPALWALMEYASLEKQGSAFVTKLLDGIHQAIHARFEVLGAGTSRTSCRQPNLQQQPRLPGVRECFVARDGMVFLACDYDTQEMRTLAQSCLDLLDCECKLARRFQEDPHFDPHLEFAASSLLKVPFEDALALYKAKDKTVKAARQRAKIANFGLPGGMGVRGLIRYAKGYGVDLSYAEAEELRNGWFQQWPEMVDYFKRIAAMTAYTEECDVVIVQSGFKRGAVGYTNAANTYFQGLAAHASKAALFETSRRCYNVRDSWLYGSRPVNFVHDEIVCETPLFVAHEAAQELETLMVEQMQRYTPDIPVAATAALMFNWSKDAEPVHNEDGRLVPWEAAA